MKLSLERRWVVLTIALLAGACAKPQFLTPEYDAKLASIATQGTPQVEVFSGTVSGGGAAAIHKFFLKSTGEVRAVLSPVSLPSGAVLIAEVNPDNSPLFPNSWCAVTPQVGHTIVPGLFYQVHVVTQEMTGPWCIGIAVRPEGQKTEPIAYTVTVTHP